jgi:uncharacterized membrane protein
MTSYELGWTEVLILLLVIVIGVSTFSFYYAGTLMGYEGTPILVMQMVSVVIQLVILSVLYKIYTTIESSSKKAKK